MRKKIAVILCMAISCLIYSQKIQAVPIQWEVSSGGNDHWYEAIYSPNGTWVDAQNAVSAMGSSWYLATITSQQENDFILSLFQSDPNYWVYGGHSSLVGDVYSGP